jgi:hypothetical protein
MPFGDVKMAFTPVVDASSELYSALSDDAALAEEDPRELTSDAVAQDAPTHFGWALQLCF